MTKDDIQHWNIPKYCDDKGLCYWYNSIIIALSFAIICLILLMILKAKYSRTKLINRLSLPPLYALLAFIILVIFQEFLY